MDSRNVIRKMLAAGWYEVRVAGSHDHFRHPDRPGTVTMPHPKKDLPVGTVRSIERQFPADPDLHKAERVNVMLSRSLLRRIDAVAPNRSRFLAEAAEHALAGDHTDA